MRISRNWLSDYVDFSELSHGEFEELITTKVAEAEGIEIVGSALERAKVCTVKRVQPHPKREKLAIAEVSIGGTEAKVVCGAPNLREGMSTVYVPPGGRIRPIGAEATILVEAREINGVVSEGVLVSEAELEIGGDASGILVLDEKSKPGLSLAELLGPPDAVIVIDNKSLTHRPDLWCHLGFAREIAAILGRPLKKNPDQWADDQAAGKDALKAFKGAGSTTTKIVVESTSKCRRFSGIEIKNVRTQPSPFWLRRRLHSIGAGVRGLLVDLSNYCMHDIGQPNHAYDADVLSGTTITVRLAKNGESFQGLDGEERRLNGEDIVIADGAGVVALGGVIGGAKSSLRNETTRVFLESANFDPTAVRLTTKRHALRTDASNRFEKSLSPFQVPLALHRYVELLRKEQPNIELVGGVVEQFPEVLKPVIFPISNGYIRERLGAPIEDKEIDRIITSLGFRFGAASKSSAGARDVTVPYYRASRDVTIPDDLVEEVGRIYGYGRVPEQAPMFESLVPRPDMVKMFEYQIEDLLSGAGFSEIYNYSFVDKTRAEGLGYPMAQAVQLTNPIDSTLGFVRMTLVPGMIDAISKNARFREQLAMFEFGRTYQFGELPEHSKLRNRRVTKNAPAGERRLLTIGYVNGEERIEKHPFDAAFYELAGIVERIAQLVCRSRVQFKPLSGGAGRQGDSTAEDFGALRSWMHPSRASSVLLNGKRIGVIAEVHPLAGDDLPPRTVVAELDVELLLEAESEQFHYQPLPRFPDSVFEMSVVMPERTPYAELEAALTKGRNSSLLRRIEVLDVYTGKPLKSGEKSVSVKLFLGADDRTLGTEELKSAQEEFMQQVVANSFSLRA